MISFFIVINILPIQPLGNKLWKKRPSNAEVDKTNVIVGAKAKKLAICVKTMQEHAMIPRMAVGKSIRVYYIY